MKSVAYFGCAVLFVFLVAEATSIYAFDEYDHAWGRMGSFQVEAWLALVGALIAMGSFGISSAALHRVHAHRPALLLGSLAGVAYVVVYICIIDRVPPSAGAYVALLLLIAVSGLASLAGQRRAE